MGALSDILAWGGIAMMFVGMIAQTIADSSIRRRPTLSVVGVILALTGMLLPHGLAHEPWRMVLQLVTTAAVLYFALAALWRLLNISKRPRPSKDVHA